jgi:hypothetical protein
MNTLASKFTASCDPLRTNSPSAKTPISCKMPSMSGTIGLFLRSNDNDYQQRLKDIAIEWIGRFRTRNELPPARVVQPVTSLFPAISNLKK